MFSSAGKWIASLFGSSTGAGAVFHPTQTCAECGSRFMRAAGTDGGSCPNLDCPAQIRARLAHWCSPEVMDIPGADPELIAQIVGKGLARDVAELYRLKTGEIAGLPGRDRESARKFFDALTASLQREAWRVVFGLGIPNVGETEARALCRHFRSVDDALSAGADRLKQVEGVPDPAAESIVRWYSDSVNRKLVRRLLKAGVNFKPSPDS